MKYYIEFIDSIYEAKNLDELKECQNKMKSENIECKLIKNTLYVNK